MFFLKRDLSLEITVSGLMLLLLRSTMTSEGLSSVSPVFSAISSWLLTNSTPQKQRSEWEHPRVAARVPIHPPAARLENHYENALDRHLRHFPD